MKKTITAALLALGVTFAGACSASSPSVNHLSQGSQASAEALAHFSAAGVTGVASVAYVPLKVTEEVLQAGANAVGALADGSGEIAFTPLDIGDTVITTTAPDKALQGQGR